MLSNPVLPSVALIIMPGLIFLMFHVRPYTFLFQYDPVIYTQAPQKITGHLCICHDEKNTQG